jgi:DNA-binding XRE family transcriptional regulator
MIGMSIRVLRKRNKMSQEILAERVNVSRQTVAKWENEEALQDIHKRKNVSRYLSSNIRSIIWKYE